MYFAATSELFGQTIETPQNEMTPFFPRSPYDEEINHPSNLFKSLPKRKIVEEYLAKYYSVRK